MEKVDPELKENRFFQNKINKCMESILNNIKIGSEASWPNKNG